MLLQYNFRKGKKIPLLVHLHFNKSLTKIEFSPLVIYITRIPTEVLIWKSYGTFKEDNVPPYLIKVIQNLHDKKTV